MILRTQIMTSNICYRTKLPLAPQGIMWHSTGANNPYLKRYVAPDDGYIGKNAYNNHWNQYKSGDVKKGVHFFIGKQQDGTVAIYQVLPLDIQGMHAGGAANRTHLSFEICEDGLRDAKYAEDCYNAAVELTAYLCEKFNLDPMKDGVILDHATGHKRGVASNHADVMHWFSRYGKSLEGIKKDVAKSLRPKEAPKPAYEKIARVVAAEARGEPYVGQQAVAQCIYDRLHDAKKRFGKNLDDVLRPGQFAAPWMGNLSNTQCLDAVVDVFDKGVRVFTQPVYFFLGKSASAETRRRRNEKYISFGIIGGHEFWGDEKPKEAEKPAAFKPYTVRVDINNLNIRKGPGTTHAVVGQTGKGVFTIVEEKDGWGRLKSGAGWISLNYTKRRD